MKEDEYEHYGWVMWDKDGDFESSSFFVFHKTSPVKSEEDQRAHGGDHQGHIWAAFKLYRKIGSITT